MSNIIFSLNLNHFKKAQSLKFGIKNANLATLLPGGELQLTLSVYMLALRVCCTPDVFLNACVATKQRHASANRKQLGKALLKDKC